MDLGWALVRSWGTAFKPISVGSSWSFIVKSRISGRAWKLLEATSLGINILSLKKVFVLEVGQRFQAWSNLHTGWVWTLRRWANVNWLHIDTKAYVHTKWNIAERGLENLIGNVGVVCSCFTIVSPSPNIKTCTNNYQYRRAKKNWEASGNWNVGTQLAWRGNNKCEPAHTGKLGHSKEGAQGEQVMAKNKDRRARVGCKEHWLNQSTWSTKSRSLRHDGKYPENWQRLSDSKEMTSHEWRLVTRNLRG